MKIKVKTTRDLWRQEREAWLQDCRIAARKLLRTRAEITINDVLEVCPRPSYLNPNVTGSVFQDNDFRLVRYTRSTKRSAHARVIGVWGLSQLQLPLSYRGHKRRNVEAE